MTTLTQEEIEAAVDAVLERHGMSREEFIELGEQDGLVEDELRDLWLMTKAVVAS